MYSSSTEMDGIYDVPLIIKHITLLNYKKIIFIILKNL